MMTVPLIFGGLLSYLLFPKNIVILIQFNPVAAERTSFTSATSLH